MCTTTTRDVPAGEQLNSTWEQDGLVNFPLICIPSKPTSAQAAIGAREAYLTAYIVCAAPMQALKSGRPKKAEPDSTGRASGFSSNPLKRMLRLGQSKRTPATPSQEASEPDAKPAPQQAATATQKLPGGNEQIPVSAAGADAAAAATTGSPRESPEQGSTAADENVAQPGSAPQEALLAADRAKESLAGGGEEEAQGQGGSDDRDAVALEAARPAAEASMASPQETASSTTVPPPAVVVVVDAAPETAAVAGAGVAEEEPSSTTNDFQNFIAQAAATDDGELEREQVYHAIASRSKKDNFTINHPDMDLGFLQQARKRNKSTGETGKGAKAAAAADKLKTPESGAVGGSSGGSGSGSKMRKRLSSYIKPRRESVGGN
ncbi:hypothetical protein BX600DRAFT_441518 [Xylariales sp. PMI_506]|nr:hypothetical protein BX600DRAFT_441518 [Xylariales sp. PMI_506]